MTVEIYPHVRKHSLEVRAVEIRSRVAVIHIELGVRKSVLLCVLSEELFLIGNRVTITLRAIVTGESAIEGGNAYIFSLLRCRFSLHSSPFYPRISLSDRQPKHIPPLLYYRPQHPSNV